MPEGPKEWSPWTARWPGDIFESAARALFVNAWADREEEEGRTYPGQELMEVAPETPDDARLAAASLFKSTELVNKKQIENLYFRALKLSGKEDNEHWRDLFGHYLAMEALGHGVGLGDEFRDHGVEVPDVTYYL
jgi:hypothetical protein